MKRFSFLLVCFLMATTTWAQQAKYVFYFIGDGMGVNQVNTTEMYLSELKGQIGVTPLLYANLPVAGMAYTFSGSNSITDSAAGGTALATSKKTYNGAIGVDLNKQPINSVADAAHKAGRKVGIATTVSIDHATPACFYAHQPQRSMYYEIACDLPKSNFEFFAGSGFLKPNKTYKGEKAPSIYPMFEEAGYTMARGLDEFKQKKSNAKKMILMQREGADASKLPYAIDRKDGDLKLSEITKSGIDFLTKGKDKGFFMMIEGGQIDWACHSNDPATVVNEVIDFDEAIKVAYEFYKKHPKQTLIVISADHETGGLGMGIGDYTLHLKSLSYQKQSIDQLSKDLAQFRKEKKNNVTWDDMKAFLGEKMGFWKDLKITWAQERRLHDEFERSFVQNKIIYAQSEYSRTEPLADVARGVMSEIAHIGWTTGGHTAEYVPVYAVGAGQDLFRGKMNNIEIAKRISKAAGYKM